MSPDLSPYSPVYGPVQSPVSVIRMNSVKAALWTGTGPYGLDYGLEYELNSRLIF